MQLILIILPSVNRLMQQTASSLLHSPPLPSFFPLFLSLPPPPFPFSFLFPPFFILLSPHSQSLSFPHSSSFLFSHVLVILSIVFFPSTLFFSYLSSFLQINTFHFSFLLQFLNFSFSLFPSSYSVFFSLSFLPAFCLH